MCCEGGGSDSAGHRSAARGAQQRKTATIHFRARPVIDTLKEFNVYQLETMLSSAHSLFRNARAALLLVVVACALPDRAKAECGDHVVVLKADTATAPDTGLPSAQTTAERAPPVKLPCSGPNCSRKQDGPTPPPFAPPQADGPQGKELAQALDSNERPDSTSSPVSAVTFTLPARSPSSIFHPPRFG